MGHTGLLLSKCLISAHLCFVNSLEWFFLRALVEKGFVCKMSYLSHDTWLSIQYSILRKASLYEFPNFLQVPIPFTPSPSNSICHGHWDLYCCLDMRHKAHHGVILYLGDLNMLLVKASFWFYMPTGTCKFQRKLLISITLTRIVL